jgi:hypothetical protein
MAASVTGTAKASLQFTHTPDSGFYSGQAFPSVLNVQASFGSGTTADNVDKVGVKVLTLTASNTQTVDLTTDLIDPTGTAVSFAEIAAIEFRFIGTNASQTVAIKEGASNGCTSFISATNGTGITLKASTNSNQSGIMFIAPNDAAYVVNATTKTLLVTPSAHAGTLQILAAGRSA